MQEYIFLLWTKTLPAPNSWSPSYKGKHNFLDFLRKEIIYKAQTVSWKDKREKCNFCNSRIDIGTFILTLKIKKKKVNIHVPNKMLHMIIMHNLRPPIEFFKYIKNRRIEEIFNLKTISKIDTDVYEVL